MVKGSFFWNALLQLKSLFDWSTEWTVNQGAAISYWFDNWIKPIMAQRIAPLPANRMWSLQQAIQNDLPHFDISRGAAEDKLWWKWTANKVYSAGSFYNTYLSGGRVKWAFHYTWQLQIPPSVKIFAYLCIKGKLLTHDVMSMRGIECDLQCVLCPTCPVETMLHLLFDCQYARKFWFRFRLHLGFPIMTRRASIPDTVTVSYQRCRSRLTRKLWGIYFFSGCWVIWKERNNKIFQGKCRDPNGAAENAFKQALMWEKFC